MAEFRIIRMMRNLRHLEVCSIYPTPNERRRIRLMHMAFPFRPECPCQIGRRDGNSATVLA